MMDQIARGMVGLHEEGTVHKDLKASNFLVELYEYVEEEGNLNIEWFDTGVTRIYWGTDPNTLQIRLLNCDLAQQYSLSSLPKCISTIRASLRSVFLDFLHQALLGFDVGSRGGSKAYSSGSLDFRDIYISIVLFHGSYVWIKFRDVATKGVYCRSIQDKQGRIKHKYEPRFKPPREKGLGSSKSRNWIYLGQFDTCYEAEVLYHIAASYYGKAEGRLDLGDGSFYTIPSMNEEEQSLCGTAKVEWIKIQAKRVYEEFKKEKAVRNLPPTSREPVGEDDGAESMQEILAAFDAQMLNQDGQINMEERIDDQGNEFNLTISQFQQPFLANQTVDVGMDNATQGQSAQLAPNRGDESICNTNNQVELLQILVSNQHQLQMQQQILELQQQQILQQLCLNQQELQQSKLQAVQLQQQLSELQEQQHLHQQIQEFNTQS